MIIKKIYSFLLNILTKLFGIDFAKQFDALLRFHRYLNLNNPSSLADKVSYIELHKQSHLAPMCTDKYAVRNYIKEKGLAEILIPCIGGPWSNFEEIDFTKLPKTFVLKATHGCKMNLIVNNKENLDLVSCKNIINNWLNTTYGTYSVEPHYYNIPHRIYVEENMGDAEELIDYKIYCLNGKPEFIQVSNERFLDQNGNVYLKKYLYDTNWNCINAVVDYKNEIKGTNKISKPLLLTKMLEIATILSSDFLFVRVDLYEIKNKVYFGELTFSPSCCVFPNFSEQFLNEMGKKLKI